MEVVTERLLHEERKQKDKESSGGPSKALFGSGRTIRCFHCNKIGHIKKNCRLLAADYGKGKEGKSRRGHAKANTASATRSSSASDPLIVQQALQAGAVENWIVDSGATCHMCSDKQLFSK